MPGPLDGVRVIELGGIGPAPFCGMLLADLGADVLRIDRPGGGGGHVPDPKLDLLHRGKRSLALNLKDPRAIQILREFVAKADILTEGYRPGVAEKLGLGPDACLALNPRLVYGRMTGWGQDGPLAKTAGHDLTYLALSGALHAIGRAGDRPVPPLNLVADFGGGGMLLAVGVLSALVRAKSQGQGQVVDAAMIDGAALLMTMMHGLLAAGLWRDERGVNLLDSGAPFYEVYETSDGRHLAVAPIEPAFYGQFLARAGITDPAFEAQMDVAEWPALKAKLATLLRTRTRDEWVAIFEGSDACVAPVLSMTEAPGHPHNVARGTFVQRDGVVQAAPAPRFSATPGAIQRPPPSAGEHTRKVLEEAGFQADQVAGWLAEGVVGEP